MASTPLKHMKVSWGYYSQLEKTSSKPPTSDCGRLNLMCYLNFLRLSASGLAAGSQDLRSKGSEGASHWRRIPQSNYQPYKSHKNLLISPRCECYPLVNKHNY
jgi:hypothetical protein